MTYKPPPIIEVDLSDLKLDLENYRIEIDAMDQEAVIQYLFDEDEEAKLLEDILRDGYFDNEIPLVVPGEDSTYYVMEGNRRICALKCINEPELALSNQKLVEAKRKKYEKELESVPKRIRVMPLESREVAMTHLEKMHIGKPKRGWGRFSQAKFYFDRFQELGSFEELKLRHPKASKPLLRLAAAERFLWAAPLRVKANRDFLESGELKPASFERLTNRSELAQAVGIEFAADGSLEPTGKKPEEIGSELKGKKLKALEYAISQFRLGKLNTRSEAFKTDTPEYYKLLGKLTGKPTQQPEGEGGAQADAEDNNYDDDEDSTGDDHGDQNPGGDGDKPRGRHHNPSSDQKLNLKSIPRDHLPPNMRHRLHELSTLRLKNHPYAAAMLMRSVLETSIKYHYDQKGRSASGRLSHVVQQVATDYGKEAQIKNVLPTIKSGQAKPAGSVGWFNAVTHDGNFPVDHNDVLAAWKLNEPLVRFLLKPAPKNADGSQ
ncbi:MAG: hypothetical protein WAS05_05580 [Candidatus Nanopelagicales bacterium]